MRSTGGTAAASSAARRLSCRGLAGGRARFARELYEGLRECGFVVLRDHPIPAGLLRRAYELSRRLFDLPLDVKMRYDSGSGGARGYTAFGRENAAGNPTPDLKEFWHVGPEPATGPGGPPPNVWPAELPGFKACFVELHARLTALGLDLLDAVGEAMGLAPSFFRELTAGGDSICRLLHYPALGEGMAAGGAMRAAPHTDINLLTLLVGATDSGLELRGADGGWLPVPSRENEIVLDTGDMMARLTNGMLPSTVHRVANPAAGDRSRYSMPFFLHPRGDASLACPPQCLGEEGPKHPPITAGEYLRRRLREIGLLDP